MWILLVRRCWWTDIPARAAVENNNDVYYISTAEELVKILEGQREGKGYFELTEDIDLSGYDWEPIGPGWNLQRERNMRFAMSL